MEVSEMDHLSGMNLEVDADAGRHITDAGKWAKFIAIVMFIACGLGLLVLLAGSTVLDRMLGSTYPFMNRYSSFGTGIFIVIILITAAVFIYLFYLLFNFSQKAPAGVAAEDDEQLSKGFQSLKLYFIISTSISIVALLFALYNLATSKIL
jgi:heme/copper-type cytochrome/quinol oxidase subunit 2